MKAVLKAMRPGQWTKNLFVVAPVLWLAKTADSLERRWVATLSGFPLSEQERPTPHTPEASLPRESREKVGHA